MKTVQGRFIILRKMKYGEADLILHAISATGAKCSFIARAALKSKKRFGGGVLEPSHYVQLTYKEPSQSGGLLVLQEATLLNEFKNLRRSYDHLEFALHVLECVARVSLEGDENSEFLFNLLGHALKAIEICDDLLVLKMQFYLKFLLQQGVIQPEAWMGPFLKVPLAEVNSLGAYRLKVDEELHTIEQIVQHYIHNAVV